MSNAVRHALSRGMVIVLLWAGADIATAAGCNSGDAGRSAMQAHAQALVDGFVKDVRAHDDPAFERIAVVVHTTPSLTHLDRERRTIVVPCWHALAPATRAAFEQRAGDTQGGRRLFELMISRFLVVQQAAMLLSPSGPDHYRNEADANARAVAYWMRNAEGQALLSALQPLVIRAFGRTPDPVPEDTTPSVYFNRGHDAFRLAPMPYGWFRLRAILSALDARPRAGLSIRVEHWSGLRG